MERREFIKINTTGFMGLALASIAPPLLMSSCEKDLFFKISLAQWSLHRTLKSGELDTLNFPAKAKNDFNINAVEYVNSFFFDKANNKNYLSDLLLRTNDLNVENVLIMVDGEGHLGETKQLDRSKTVEKHYKWVEAAQHLGCHSIRVNASGDGSETEVAKHAEESLFQLATFAKDYKINVIVENHGSYSSMADWLIPIIKNVNLENCGTLPDFGNFYKYDRYQGVKEMMPFAKGVSAKTNSFTTNGTESTIDYTKMLQIVKNSNYSGYIGIEYEGPNDNEDLGIQKTKDLLLKIGNELS